MPEFVRHRPSIPLGTRVASFPGVRRALHCSMLCELYLLEEQQGASLVALYTPQPPGVEPEGHRSLLDRWWRLLGTDRIRCEYVAAGSLGAYPALEAVLTVKGSSLVDDTRCIEDLNDDRVLAMVSEVTHLCRRGLEDTLGPVLSPSLVWHRWQGSMSLTAPILAAATSAVSEEDLVRGIGRLVYLLATGVDPFGQGNAVATTSPPMTRWAKQVTPALSRLIARCIAGGSAVDRIPNLVGLAGAIDEAKEPRDGDHEKATAPTARKTPVSGKGPKAPVKRGLARVAGMQELKALLFQEVVTPLRDPEPFRRYGLDVPNGVLLFGPPGCGKTYIARQLAEELGYFFLEIVPSEIASPFIHQSVLKIRDIFETAAERAPTILFIDEFEALVPARSELGGHQQYKSEEVNEFLVHLGNCSERGIFLIAATNEPEKIDHAIRRTGRLDKLIYVGPPDREARVEMLRLHLEDRPTASGLDLDPLAGELEGYSASDLKLLVDEAARAALQQGSRPIGYEHLLTATKRVPASLTAAVLLRYERLGQRGV